jgi:hypothetical protein
VCRGDHSVGGFPPSVACLSKILYNEKTCPLGAVAQWGENVYITKILFVLCGCVNFLSCL